MTWFLLALDLTPLLLAGLLMWLLRKLRRYGLRDRPAEMVTASGAAFAAGHLAANLTVDDPPGWLPYMFVVPWTAICFGFAFHRIRTHLPRTLAHALNHPPRSQKDSRDGGAQP